MATDFQTSMLEPRFVDWSSRYRVPIVLVAWVVARAFVLLVEQPPDVWNAEAPFRIAAPILLFDVITIAVLWRLPRAIDGSSGAVAAHDRTAICVLAYIGLTFACGSLFFERLDIVVLAAAVSVICYGAMTLPPRLRWAAGLAALALAGLVGGQRLLTSLIGGEVQIESAPSALYMLLHHVGSLPLASTAVGGEWHLEGTRVRELSIASGVLSLAVVSGIVVCFVRTLLRERDPAERRWLFVRAFLASAVAMICTSASASVSWLVWIAPLTALLAADRVDRLGNALSPALLAFGLTRVVSSNLYEELAALQLFPVLVSTARNAVAIWLLLALLRGAPRYAVEPADGRRRIWLERAAVAALFGWVGLASFSTSTTNDVWIHMRVGHDVLIDHSIPYVDSYSAVAGGRPFIAHEWLAGVVFYALERAMGGAGLTLLQVGAGLACVTLMYLAIARDDRRTPFVLPVLLACSYLVLMFQQIRPHLFSHVALCGLVFGLERWRRHRKIWRVAWLVPMHTLWANLHGSYFVGPVLLLCLAGAAGLLALFPHVQKRGAEPAYGWKDAAALGGLGVASLAATLINPYGWELHAFSLEMLHGNDYIKSGIFEWLKPWDSRGYGFSIWVATALVLWASLAWRITQWPALDFVLAGVATFLPLRAWRFYPEFAILALPVLARGAALSWRHAMRRQTWPAFSLGYVLACALLVASTAVYGFSYAKNGHRELGIGHGGDPPYAAASYIKSKHYRGAILNEYTDGAYLIYALYPDVRPVMDARIDIYGEELFAEYNAALSSPETLVPYLKKYDITLVLTRVPELREFLESTGEWVFEDTGGSRMLMVRSTGR